MSPGLIFFLHAAHGADGDDLFHAELFHAVDVRLVVDVRGEEAVPATVAGQKCHPFAMERADDVII